MNSEEGKKGGRFAESSEKVRGHTYRAKCTDSGRQSGDSNREARPQQKEKGRKINAPLLLLMFRVKGGLEGPGPTNI